MVSMVKDKKKHQKFLMTSILLYYFAISEYKIVILSTSRNRPSISQVMLGLLKSLEPFTYIYPIVGATITPHHF